jgi:hypothetical protein
MKRRGGAAYFEPATGAFIKNERYETVPDIRFLKPSDTWLKELELDKCSGMYELLREPEKLDFLINPDERFT